jgi:hypothetical protein
MNRQSEHTRALISSDIEAALYIGANVWMRVNNELERIWK